MNETQTPPPPHTPPPPPAPPAPAPVLRRRDGPIGGVAAGVAHYLDVDVTLVRIAFVLLTLVGGSGVFLYLAGWLLIPTEQQDRSARPVVLRTQSVPAVIGAVILALGAWIVLGPFDGDGGLVVPLLLVGVGVWLLNQRPAAGPVPDPAPVAGPATASAPPTGPFPDPRTGSHPEDVGGAGRDATLELAPIQARDHTVELAPSTGTDPDTEQGGWWHPSGGEPPLPPPGAAPSYAVPHGPGEPARTTASGPPITSITLAVLALAVGLLFVLETVDAIDLSAVAVAATALVVIGAGLVSSAFLGRARGLVPLGLLAALGLAVAPAADLALDGGIADREIRVADSGEIEDRYRLGVGSLVVDLSDVDPDDLDREMEVTVGIGVAEVIVPEGLRVEVEGRSAAGYVELFGREEDGMGTSLQLADGPLGDDVLVLDANARIGAVVVRRG